MANVIDITNDGRKVYKCDPDKNTECTKENCFINGGECSGTMKKEYARVMTNGHKFNEVFKINKLSIPVYLLVEMRRVINIDGVPLEKWLQAEYEPPQEVKRCWQ